MSFVDEFMAFLNKHKVVGLAIAFIMGAAATDLVKAIVNDLVMPVIGVLTPSGDWQAAVFQLGPVKFMAGHFVGALLNFVVIALVVFLLVKFAVKEEEKK
ncbi:Large-conductance mechanosensitive channel [uncultured archaeon]|nr:Large-conductance mechanosensitive channel [uncultured archaeon]